MQELLPVNVKKGEKKGKPPLITPKGGGPIIDSFALSSFGGGGGGCLTLHLI